jgi:hypothetical protein
MSDGGEIGALHCNDVVLYSYQVLIGSSLPLYVGEVHDNLIRSDELPQLLTRLKYAFRLGEDAESKMGIGPFHHIHVDGGVMIDIVCANVQLQR